jgi:hypothetical protein
VARKRHPLVIRRLKGKIIHGEQYGYSALSLPVRAI